MAPRIRACGRLTDVRVIAAPDKFRGTARAPEVAAAIGEAAWEAGWECTEVPLSDGGEGLLDAFGGANRHNEVHGPSRRPVRAAWRYSHHLAVIEMAAASGLDVAGGPDHNDPVQADTTGTGELLLAAVEAGARRIVVGLGGSASTDGGLGAVRVVGGPARLGAVELIAACDVAIPFADAATRFAPQKGATPAQVRLLERRLARTAQLYRDEFGVDVTSLVHAGAAGGLGGGLAVLGAKLVPGFEVVADEVDLDVALEGADLVVTGEGFVDAASYEGKVVGGVVSWAAERHIDVLVVAGDVFDGMEERAPTVSLVATFGAERAHAEPLACVREVVAERLRRGTPR
jgi:glycerate kinase